MRAISGSSSSSATIAAIALPLGSGLSAVVLTDAYAPFDHDTAKHALSSVTMSGGIFGAIGTSADLLAALSTGPAPPPRS